MAKARAVQHAGHAHHLVMRQAAELAQRPDHGVQRIGDADDESVGGMRLDAFADRGHDFEVDAQKIVAAHARFARHARRDDDHVGARNVGIGIGALELGIEAFHRSRLRDVERLALRQAFHDVEQHDIAELFQADEKRQRAADLAAADERDFVAGHGETPVGKRKDTLLLTRVTSGLRAASQASADDTGAAQ